MPYPIIHDNDICIFDMDGTLTRPSEDAYKYKNFSEKTGIDLIAMAASGRRWLLGKKILGRVFDEARMMGMPIMSNASRPNHASVGILKAAHAAGAHCILYSDAPGEGYGKDICKKNNWDQYFNDMIFREDTQQRKPNADAVAAILDEINVGHEGRIFVFGDEDKDEIVARNLTEKGFVNVEFIHVSDLKGPAAAYYSQPAASKSRIGVSKYKPSKPSSV